MPVSQLCARHQGTAARARPRPKGQRGSIDGRFATAQQQRGLHPIKQHAPTSPVPGERTRLRHLENIAGRANSDRGRPHVQDFQAEHFISTIIQEFKAASGQTTRSDISLPVSVAQRATQACTMRKTLPQSPRVPTAPIPRRRSSRR